MATIALSLAGQVIGGAVGGPIGATIGRALGALAGSAVDAALFAREAAAGAGARCPAHRIERGRGDPAALRLGAAERQHHLGHRARADGGREPRRQGDGAGGGGGDLRELRRRLLRGRGGAARPGVGRRAAARNRGAEPQVLSRYRGAGGRQPDRGQAGHRFGAGLSRASATWCSSGCRCRSSATGSQTSRWSSAGWWASSSR